MLYRKYGWWCCVILKEFREKRCAKDRAVIDTGLHIVGFPIRLHQICPTGIIGIPTNKLVRMGVIKRNVTGEI